MSEDSKKRQELKKQINSKTQSAPLELVEKIADVLNSPKRWQIVERVATIPGGIEAKKFILCFDYLNWNECQLAQFDQAKGKRLLQVLEQISKCEISKFPELRLIKDSVTAVGPYVSLFNKLSPEVDKLQEAVLGEG